MEISFYRDRSERKLCCSKAYFTSLSAIKIWIYRSPSAEKREYLKFVSAIFGVRYCNGCDDDDEPRVVQPDS